MTPTMLHMFPALAAYLLVIAAVLGACLGSFMNCLAWRLANGESALRGRSHCPHCDAQLRAAELIPVVSWLALRGRCRHCKHRIAVRYVLVEAVMAAVFVLLALHYGFTVQALAYAALACILCGVTLVDADTFTIPNGFIVAGIAVWAASVWFMDVPLGSFGPGTAAAGLFGTGFLAVLVDGLVGAVLIGGGILLFSLMFDRVVGRESLGGGDVKLLFMVSLFLGAPLGLFNLLVSCVLGLVIAFALGLSGGRARSSEVDSDRAGAPGEPESFRTKAIPFGPAIASATVLTLLVGPACLTWYAGLL